MFRFTIRELLILTVTAGLAAGWWIDHRRSAEWAKSQESRASLWESRTGRMVDLLGTDGWDVTWKETPNNQSVTMRLPNGGVKYLFRGR